MEITIDDEEIKFELKLPNSVVLTEVVILMSVRESFKE